jgi:hypothetical protein
MRTRTLATLAAGIVAALVVAGSLGTATLPAARADEAAGLAAFETVKKVLQHPRCVNCHIPGDAPLQLDDSRVHAQNVKRGADGKGAAGFSCSTCHGEKNPPASYGARMPPGAPNWHLPPANMRMVFLGRSSAELARTLKDPAETNGKDLQAMIEHVAHDKLVLWGWDPGVGRAPVSVPHAEFVAAFKAWVAAGAPVPAR